MPKETLTYSNSATIPATIDDKTDVLTITDGVTLGTMTINKNAVVGGNPIIYIVGSNDDTNFENVYVDEADVADTFELVDNINVVEFTDFFYTNLAVFIDSNGATGGDISINLNYKNGL